MPSIDKQLKQHQTALRDCRLCKAMHGPPVHGEPVTSRVLLVGQAPGSKEIEVRRPFAWTAGKTLFSWFAGIGLDEDAFRQRVYMSAVCRCFPGKKPRGGDRVPSREEIETCARWLDAELELLQPRLVIPVGKLAISRFLEVDKLTGVIGRCHSLALGPGEADLIPLPHPSGASTWHRTEPGKSLLAQALQLIQAHPHWQALLKA